MGRVPVFVIFLAVVITVFAGLHTYLWMRLIRDTHLPSPWRAIATTLLVLAAISVPLVLFLRRAAPSTHFVSQFLAWPAYTWIGLMFLLVVALASADLVRLVFGPARRAFGGETIDVERRAFFARWIAGGAVVTGLATGAAAVRSALSPVAVRRIEVPLRRLAREQDGVTLAQLTDLHIGPSIGRRELGDLVQRTNAIAPDVVVITGDLVDGSVEELRDSVAPLADLKAKYGTFFVTGNHEYFSGATEWVRELGRIGIRVLRNERVTIGSPEVGFQLAGVDDRSASRYPADGHGEDLAKALSGRDPARAVVLLAHQPRTVLDSAKLGVDLQLSGHTHGGQIWPFGALVRLQQGFLAGLARHGDTMIYVSRGTGYWGPPMRLFAPAEITQIVFAIGGGVASPITSTTRRTGRNMDWKILLSTFGAVFVAELGDKTQLATLSMASGADSKWAVFAGSALALCATSALAVLGGGLVSRVVSPLVLRRIAGGAFIALGAWFLLARSTT